MRERERLGNGLPLLQWGLISIDGAGGTTCRQHRTTEARGGEQGTGHPSGWTRQEARAELVDPPRVSVAPQGWPAPLPATSRDSPGEGGGGASSAEEEAGCRVPRGNAWPGHFSGWKVRRCSWHSGCHCTCLGATGASSALQTLWDIPHPAASPRGGTEGAATSRRKGSEALPDLNCLFLGKLSCPLCPPGI